MEEPNRQEHGDGEQPEARHEGDMNEDRRQRVRAMRAERIALHDFLALIAGNRRVMAEQATAHDHEELVYNLKRSGNITSDAVYKAMMVCPRGSFVPQEYQEEAYIDAPIRVEDMDFNISAPHMHATALEALQVRPNDRFLDVGSGCGIVAACAAYMVGKGGEVVGVDIKEYCVNLGRSNVDRLSEENSEFKATACPVMFDQHNIFMAPARYRSYFDKIHVGASCPEERLHLMMSLLKEEGGMMMVPVGSDLRLITRHPHGGVSHSVISQVRFSDLECPTDAEIVAWALEEHVRSMREVKVPPASDSHSASQHMRNLLKKKTTSVVAGQDGEVASVPVPDLSPAGAEKDQDQDDEVSVMRDQDQPGGDGDGDLGVPSEPHDCYLAADGWRLGAHRLLLEQRCDLFRAKLSSGMRDAQDQEVRVPENFSQMVMEAFLFYVYHDALPPDLDPNLALDLVHVGTYFGTPRLIGLCEALLAEALFQGDAGASAEAAPGLLVLAMDNGLSQLKNVALSYITEHFDEVREGESYCHLGPAHLDLVAGEMFKQMRQFKEMLKTIAMKPLPRPRW